MIIHVVEPGDTVYSIARQYGVSVEQLLTNNGLGRFQNLVVGQTVVVLFPAQVHTVAEGETLLQIAADYGVSVNTLLQNNPVLTANEFLYPGQTLVIRYDDQKEGYIAVNGYAYPFINRWVLRRQLPYLTYLSIFTYGFTPEGDLVVPDDEELIAMALEYGTAPLLVLAAMSEEGTFSAELAGQLFNNLELQQKVIDALANTMVQKGYYGIDVDFEFVGGENSAAFVEFMERLHQRMSALGKVVFVTLAPKISSEQPGALYEGHDYGGLGAAADRALMMTYEWGYTYGPPMAVAPINSVRQVVEYGVTQIPVQKLLLGIPNYGYDWPLPFVQGETRATTIGNVEAVEIARQSGVPIQYDEVSQAPFFHYYHPDNGQEHEVWFEDARSVQAKARLVNQYGLYGIGIWQIMRYFPQQWLVLNSIYEIIKLL